MWGHHQPDVSDHPEHDGDAPDGVVAVPLLLLGHQDEPEVGQDVGAQHLSVVYLSLLVFLRSECRNTQLCGWCQLVWRNSGNCDLMICTRHNYWRMCWNIVYKLFHDYFYVFHSLFLRIGLHQY